MANTERIDDILDQQSGRSMIEATGPGGSMDMIDHSVFGKIIRGIMPEFHGGGTKRTTQEMVDEGTRAKAPGEVLTPSQAEELAQTAAARGETPQQQATELDLAEPPIAELSAPQQAEPEAVPRAFPTIDAEQYAADVAEREAQELKKVTRERNVNFEYLDSPDDIKGVLDVNADLIPAVERETFADIEKGAESVDMASVFKGEPNSALNSRQLLAGRQMLVGMVDEIKELVDKINAGVSTDEDRAIFQRLQPQAVMLQKFMQGKIREAGRALNSMKVISRAVNSRDLQAIAEIGGSGDVQMMAKMFADLDEGGDPVDLLDSMSGLGPINRRIASIVSMWTASILTGPTTQGVNILSNASFQLVDTAIIKPLAAGISPMRRAITGDGEGAYISEMGADMLASYHAFRDAMMMAGKVFMEGTFKNQGEYISSFGGRKIDDIAKDDMKFSEAVGINNIPVLSEITNLYQRGVEAASFGGLSAGDEFFKAMAYRKSLYSQAIRQARQEGLMWGKARSRAGEILADITQAMHEQAIVDAERVTFTNETGGLVGDISRGIAGWAAGFPALRFIVPFIKTPTALFDRTIKMSPLAVLQKEFRETVSKGGAAADVALAEMAFGTTVFVFASWLYQQGSLTGSGPADYRQRAALDRLGVQRNSVRVGKKYYTYNRGLDPLGMSVGAIANMLDIINYASDEADALDYSAGVIFALAKYFKDSTYMSGIGDIMALIDGDRNEEKYFARQLAGFVPALFRDAEKLRRGSEEGTAKIYPGADFWNTFGMYTDKRLPGNIGSELPPQRYWDGTITLPGGGEALHLYNTLSPIKITYAKSDIASERMVANGVTISPPSSKITVVPKAGIKVDLMDLDNGHVLYDKLIKIVGETRRKAMDKLVNSRGFINLDNVVQKKKLEKALYVGMDVGRDIFLKDLLENPPTVEEYGENAILLSKAELTRLLRSHSKGTLDEEDTELLREAGTKGIPGRSEIRVPRM